MSMFLRQGVALACLFLLSSAYAQVATTTLGDTDLIRNRQDRLLEDQRKRLQELQDLPGPAATSAAPPTSDEGRCFTLRTIVLQGADHLSAAERARLTQPYEGQCVGVNQLNAVLKTVTYAYLAQGYVASRAYLPQQDLSQGTLTILVVEGKLESIKPANGSGLTPRELSRAFPGDPGNLLNLRELEPLVDQLNRLPSDQVQMDLVPGQEVGSSVVQLRDPLENHGASEREHPVYFSVDLFL